MSEAVTIQEFPEIEFAIMGDPNNIESAWGQLMVTLGGLNEWEDALMSLILAQYKAGIDITSEEYRSSVAVASEYLASTYA